MEEPVDAIRELIDPTWFAAGGTARMRFYSLVLASEEDLSRWASTAPSQFPVIAAVARVKELRYKSHVGTVVARPGETPRVAVSRADRVLPDGIYLILSTAEMDSDGARSLLDAYAALLRLAHGNNIAHSLVLESTVDSETGEMFMHLPNLNIPQSFDGPWLGQSASDVIHETVGALSRTHESLKRRAFLALHLLEQSARDSSNAKFFHFWTALEVLVGSHRTAAIASSLERAYGRDRRFVKTHLGFDRVTHRRQRLFHEGIGHDIPQDVEAYLHALFQDLLREQLRLSPHKLMTTQIERGFDVARLDPNIGRSNIGVFKVSDPGSA